MQQHFSNSLTQIGNKKIDSPVQIALFLSLFVYLTFKLTLKCEDDLKLCQQHILVKKYSNDSFIALNVVLLWLFFLIIIWKLLNNIKIKSSNKNTNFYNNIINLF